ncbi:MAG: YwiC-like family protein [Planctomycetota bacterium]|nr:YwiC-like family protein [Planctomycetota bacterium]
MNRPARIHRQIVVPTEHGSWALFGTPLLVGIAAGQDFSLVTLYLLVATTSGFLMRQPLTTCVMALSGRRSREYLRPAVLWTLVFAGIAALHIFGLCLRGFAYLLWLAVPGMIVLVWHLALTARRLERRQMTIEVLGAAFLALCAPAGMWVGLGTADPHGWALYALVTVHGAWAVLYGFLRLHQRAPKNRPAPPRGGVLALAIGGFVLAAGMSAAGWVPALTPVAFAVQPLETLRGRLRPAKGLMPRQIGFQLLFVAILHTVLFGAVWCLV